MGGGEGALRNVNLLTRTLEFCNYTSKSWKLFMFSLFNMNIAYSSQWTGLLANGSNRNQSKNTRHTKQKHICACIYVGQWWSERRDEISGILEELADINVFRLSIKAERQRCRHIITESVTMINESSMKLLWSRTKGPLIFFL